MEDHHTSNPEQALPVSETPIAPSQKKTNRNLFLILGGVILGLCACLGLCLLLGGASFVSILQEKAPVEEVIDTFMQAMVENDTEKAFLLFSTRAQRQIETSDLEKMLSGNNYVLFEGYQNVEIGNLNISKAINTNQDLPQGTVAKVDGTVYYEGDVTGRFDAVLEKENGIWRLHHINITVPPDKLAPRSGSFRSNASYE